MADVISEQEYQAWLTPRQTLAELRDLGADYTIVEAINERVIANMLDVAAATLRERRQEAVRYPRISPGLWELVTPSVHHSLWERGDITISVRRSHNVPDEYPYFGVRFEPKGIARIKLDAGLVIETPKLPEVLPSSPPQDKRNADLSRSEAERFCHAMLAGWPEVTQDVAHEKALLFFPDKRVPRDWFRSILRSIRGPKSPGKAPKERL